ncbi:MAG TPA: hydrogenase/urease maturation nickel metallochaperone HypA [Terriglobales bacterium]
MANLLRRIEAVTEEQDGARLCSVKIKLGALSHISPEHLRDHFLIAVCGTAAEGAELVIEASVDPADPRAQEIWLESLTFAE